VESTGGVARPCHRSASLAPPVGVPVSSSTWCARGTCTIAETGRQPGGGVWARAREGEGSQLQPGSTPISAPSRRLGFVSVYLGCISAASRVSASSRLHLAELAQDGAQPDCSAAASPLALRVRDDGGGLEGEDGRPEVVEDVDEGG